MKKIVILKTGEQIDVSGKEAPQIYLEYPLNIMKDQQSIVISNLRELREWRKPLMNKEYSFIGVKGWVNGAKLNVP